MTGYFDYVKNVTRDAVLAGFREAHEIIGNLNVHNQTSAPAAQLQQAMQPSLPAPEKPAKEKKRGQG